jgi:hypothetical protein
MRTTNLRTLKGLGLVTRDRSQLFWQKYIVLGK